jgi:hypothetical protein
MRCVLDLRVELLCLQDLLEIGQLCESDAMRLWLLRAEQLELRPSLELFLVCVLMLVLGVLWIGRLDEEKPVSTEEAKSNQPSF